MPAVVSHRSVDAAGTQDQILKSKDTMDQVHPNQVLLTHKLGICYGSIALFSSIMHNVFLLYHVETFVSVYKIDKSSFWIGETVFLIWNSFNDPFFGWISDRKYLTQKSSGFDVVLGRIRALSWNGPLLCLSFVLFWTSWGHPSLQFVVCLCLYDGFLTMIDLHHSALLADMAVSAQIRAQLNQYCSLFNTLGSLSVFLSYIVWNRENLWSFQIFCILLAAFSAAGFFIATHILRKVFIKKIKSQGIHLPRISEEVHVISQKKALKSYIKQLYTNKNFMWFSIMNLIQVFHCHFNSNFFPLFLENLLGDEVSPTFCSILLGLSFVAPHVNNMYFLSLCRKYGAYSIIKLLFIVKLVLSITMCYFGPRHIWMLCLFIASNRVFTEGTCKLLSLVISDLVDEDYVINGRQQAVSALLFGSAALLSKPGQTLAPLLGTWLLRVQTGHDMFHSGNTAGSVKMSSAHSDVKDFQRMGLFHLLVYIPIACAVLQLLAWSRFTLHGKRLNWIKHFRQGTQYALV